MYSYLPKHIFSLYVMYVYVYIFIYVYVRVCVCVYVCLANGASVFPNSSSSHPRRVLFASAKFFSADRHFQQQRWQQQPSTPRSHTSLSLSLSYWEEAAATKTHSDGQNVESHVFIMSLSII